MNEQGVHEIELTDDLFDYAKAVTITEAQKHCSKFVDFDDVVQEVRLKLLSKPPKYDPSKGASVKTLIYTIVQRIVLKYSGREKRNAARFKQVVKERPTIDEPKEGKLSDPRAGTASARERMIALEDAEAADDASPRGGAVERHHTDQTTKSWTTDDILEFIDDEESRELCRLFVECNGNRSKVARRLGVSEGSVRYRLKLLAPKLLAAGFNPFSNGAMR
jgi:RNA polymerase sigma factor (sigma-70 family)